MKYIWLNKEFVSYDIALALKELGFDEPCFALFNRSDKPVISGNTPVFNSKTEDDLIICAPLFQQAFRWFREEYGLMHIINPYDFTAEIDFLKERIVDEKYGDFIPHHHIIDDEGEEIKHSSYEEAEKACLDKLIEIVKNK